MTSAMRRPESQEPLRTDPTMKKYRPLFLLGALSSMAAGAASVDTSQWKCESCPFEQGVSGTLDLGVGHVAGASAKFGDFTGLDKNRAFLIAGGSARFRGAEGLYGDFTASDLGLDVRSLAVDAGREGLFRIKLGYLESPHHLGASAQTPFLGNGGAVLTLPKGFPAATTDAMPLAGSLQSVDIGFKRSRYDIAASWIQGVDWTYRVSLRRDVRDGTQRGAGAFFANASQLVLPVDQVTDQLEVSTSYASPRWQATLAYNASLFRNGQESVTWSNPFSIGSIGPSIGQIALAPDNQFHQLMASLGYAPSTSIRVSAEIAVGRMTQDALFLASTMNPSLAVPSLPSQSLQGGAATLNASLRLTAAATDHLRLNAVFSHDERDNQTTSASYPAVSTDMFIAAILRTNPTYSFRQDRLKLSADYRGPGSLKAGVGADQDNRDRTLQETTSTRETTLWARAAVQPIQNLSVSLKLAHSQRGNEGYNKVPWIDPAENPLLRKFNQADRNRDTLGLRADITASERVSIGFHADAAQDDFTHSTVGLTESRSISFGGDLSFAISEQSSLQFFAQGERIRSRQSGSQTYAQADWWARTDDSVDTMGLGIRHSAMGGKLALGADLALSRSRTDISIETAASSPPFPAATTALDSLRLHATYRLKENLSLTGSYWYEHFDAQDWRLMGVLPATISNLLAFGEQVPRYHANVVRLGVRYRF